MPPPRGVARSAMATFAGRSRMLGPESLSLRVPRSWWGVAGEPRVVPHEAIVEVDQELADWIEEHAPRELRRSCPLRAPRRMPLRGGLAACSRRTGEQPAFASDSSTLTNSRRGTSSTPSAGSQRTRPCFERRFSPTPGYVGFTSTCSTRRGDGLASGVSALRTSGLTRVKSR